MSDSNRFIIMMVANLFICGQARKRLGKDGKQNTFKKYMKFLLFAIIYLGINQLVFFFLQEPNLYDQLYITRSTPIRQIKQKVENLKIQILSMQNAPMKDRVHTIKRVQAIGKILTHPAQRLTYDTFGLTDTSYAWAFKNQQFLLSSIISSSIFYIICIFMNMMSRNKQQMKNALKLELIVIILVFIWQLQTILQTQSRLQQTTDFLDHIYSNFPIFQRRQFTKVLLFPFTNMLNFFLRYYVPTNSEKKIMKIANHPTLKNYTLKVRDYLSKIKHDEHLEDRIQVSISQIQKSEPLSSQIYIHQRQLIREILILQGQDILVDDDVKKILNYFHLIQQTKTKQQVQQKTE